MQVENAFVRNNVMPSWWANAIQKFVSMLAANVNVRIVNATTIEVPAAVDDGAAILGIDGNWRWNEATVQRAHPGGAAGTYTVWATAAANNIANTPDVGTDNTVRSFDLAITSGAAPTAAIYRRIATVYWDGSTLKRVTMDPAIREPVDALERKIQTVTTLPVIAEAYDGLTVDFLPLGTADRTTVWRVRYDASAPQNRRWVVVGAATPIGGRTTAGVSTGSTSYQGFPAPTSVPVAGFYEFEGGGRLKSNGGGFATIVGPGGSPSDVNAYAAVNGDAFGAGSATFEPVDFGAGAAATFFHRNVSNNVTVTDGYWIRYRPRALAAT